MELAANDLAAGRLVPPTVRSDESSTLVVVPSGDAAAGMVLFTGEPSSDRIAAIAIVPVGTDQLSEAAIGSVPTPTALQSLAIATWRSQNANDRASGSPFAPPADPCEPFLVSKRTRKPYGNRALARLALEYELMTKSGDTNPAATLAARHPETTPQQWSNLFTEARKSNDKHPALLSNPPRRGVARGELTDEGWDILAGRPGWSTEKHAVRGALIDNEQLTDLIARRADAQLRRDRGELIETELAGLDAVNRRSAYRDGGVPTDVRGANKRRRERNQERLQTSLRDLIAACDSQSQLRELYRDQAYRFQQDASLLEAWKEHGRALEGRE